MNKPREFWVLQDLHSNRAILRFGGDKHSDDVNGEPSDHWLHVIEKSAYDEAVKTLQEFYDAQAMFYFDDTGALTRERFHKAQDAAEKFLMRTRAKGGESK